MRIRDLCFSFKVADLYGISPMMFSALGTSLTVIVGAIAGYISSE